ncbi:MULTISPECIES: family 43 glycosylhydrolase [unclassified Microbacterium]|uniref:family 43 glycosylhydrolase n=1 Tax=unclassified Microbacterium TaxID=2609290 RepID=UPI003018BBCC
MTTVESRVASENQLFYRPDGGWVGDPMPCYHEGEFYVYYQCDRRQPAAFPDGEPFGWSLLKTRDLLNGTDFGEVLERGAHDDQEQWLYAGSVIHADDAFWAFYTGANRDFEHTETPAEKMMIARSADGITWEKHPEYGFHTPEGFDKDYFRDPVVVFDEELAVYRMLVAGRHGEGPRIRRGCLLEFRSADLMHWEYQGVFWSPDFHHLLQMPDLFRVGDWWYLLYSEYDDERRTRYRMARSLEGPWLAPADDSFDGRAFYAARTIEVEGRRLLFGWNPTRKDGDDLGAWIWGGNLVVHEVVQRADGSLGVAAAPVLQEAFDGPAEEREPVELERADGYAEATIVAESSECFRLDMTVTPGPATYAFGIKFYESSEDDLGYVYHFSTGDRQVRFDLMPNYPWFLLQNRGLYRPVDLTAGVEHTISLVVDGDISVLYVDDVALSSRMGRRPGQEIKLYVNGGSVRATNIRYSGTPSRKLEVSLPERG